MENQPKKKRILYFITQGNWGGAQRYVYDLAEGLAGDFEICVAIGEPCGRKNLQDKLQITNYKLQINNKIKIFQLKHLVRRISPIHDILAVFELKKLFQQLKPGVIHLNSSKAGIIGSLASCFVIRASCLVIYTVHGWVFNEPTRRLGRALYRFLEKLTAGWKDKIIVLSDKDLADGLKLGIEKEKLVKIPLGISPPKLLSRQEARQTLAKLSPIAFRHPSPTIIGAIAGLYKTKGLDILIEAVKILNLQSSIFNLQFFIIGSGPEKKHLQLLITNYSRSERDPAVAGQLPNIHLLGHIDNAAELLPAFDLFVLPSRKEGLPYTILEAMAAGAPIITTKVGGIPSLLENNKDSILIDPENSTQLAEAIAFALNNPEEMRRRAANGKKKIADLTLKKMLNNTSSLYCSSLNQ